MKIINEFLTLIREDFVSKHLVTKESQKQNSVKTAMVNQDLIALLLDNEKRIKDFLNEIKEGGNLEIVAVEYTKKTIEYFLDINQYFIFNKEAKLLFAKINLQLLMKITMLSNFQKEELENIFSDYYKNVHLFLTKTNPQVIIAETLEITESFFSEYGGLFQSELLHLDLNNFKEPILDIGCGPNYNLVNYLRNLEFDAVGVDRIIENPTTFTKQLDWFDLELEKESYGTIISHMAFSSHFIYHHNHNNSEVERFALIFKKILEALKPGGSFIYSPNMPFIEEYIDLDTYDISHTPVMDKFKTTRITKIDK